jgi:TfoX/Sxy family transcriptional regulator of competence genes
MAWRRSPEVLIQLFADALPDDARIERRKMFGYPCAFIGGHLFAGLHQESFIVRLSEADRARAKAQHGARAFEPMPGRSMREYVVLPDATLTNRRQLSSWLRRALDYAGSLPAKSPKKAKKAPTKAKSARLKQVR